jgi:histidyl-tRNA synthetase
VEEGAQSSMGSGGRYDGLVERLGGPPTPGTGFGTGFERLIINMKRQGVPVPPAPRLALYIAHLVPAAATVALELADDVRTAGHQAIVGGAGRSLKAQMRHADARGAAFVAIIGADEVAAGEVTLRNLADHSERRVKLQDVPRALSA